MSTLQRATELLFELLTTDAKEPAARLKQKLNARLIDEGMSPFDQKALGFKTFKDYLQSLGSRLSIEERPGSDILVSLGQPAGQGTDVPVAPLPLLRGEVWQAFTNPDPARLRYFNRSTGRIEHQLVSEQDGPANPTSDHVRIDPISAADQAGWMSEFIHLHSLQSETLLENIVATPYDSSVNAAFSRALGSRSIAWRRFRSDKVCHRARAWATRHGIDFASLQQTPDASQKAVQGTPAMSPRLRAVKLLESFSDKELVDLVIPILSASALVSSRT